MMKHWVLALTACGAVAAIPACSSDDSGGGSGGSATGGTGGIVTGGTGGGITGGTGGSGAGGTGGSAAGGTGGGSGGGTNCPTDFQGQPCTALQSNDPKQTACLQGQCCTATAACLADAACASFIACGSACLQGGGTPQSCGQECATCMTDPTLYNAFQTCVTNCAASDGGTSDSGTPGDAAAE
jgi:hypothetical protein